MNKYALQEIGNYLRDSKSLGWKFTIERDGISMENTPESRQNIPNIRETSTNLTGRIIFTRTKRPKSFPYRVEAHLYENDKEVAHSKRRGNLYFLKDLLFAEMPSILWRKGTRKI